MGICPHHSMHRVYLFSAQIWLILYKIQQHLHSNKAQPVLAFQATFPIPSSPACSTPEGLMAKLIQVGGGRHFFN